MQQERAHSGASAKRQKRLIQGITIGGSRIWNSAYASIKRGPAHANLKRVLAACPLRATSGHSQGDKPSAETLVPSETRKVSAFKSPLCKNRVRTRLPPWQRSADRTRLWTVYREFPSLGATAST